jgi:hypothetical protein
LDRIIERETKQQQELLNLGIPMIKSEPIATSEDKDQCAECKRFCFLSCVVCTESSNKILCLLHAKSQFAKSAEPMVMEIRYSHEILLELKNRVSAAAARPTELKDKVLRLRSSIPKPTIEAYEELLKESIEIDNLNEADDVRELTLFIANCRKWCDLTQKILTRRKGKGRQPNRSLEKVTEMMAQLTDFHFDAPEVQQLTNAYNRALDLDRRAKELTEATDIDPNEIKILKEEAFEICVDIESVDELEFTNPEAQKFIDENFGIKPLSQYTVNDLQELQKKAEDLNLTGHIFFDDIVHALEKAQDWLKNVEEILESEVKDADALRRFIVYASKWPKYPSVYSKLKACLDKFKNWKKVVSKIIDRDTDYEVGELSLEESMHLEVDSLERLELLVLEGSDYDSEELRVLKGSIEDSKKWILKVSKLFGVQTSLIDYLTHFEKLVLDARDGNPADFVQEMNTTSKPKWASLKALALDAPILARPPEAKLLLQVIIVLDSWVMKLSNELVRRPCKEYVSENLHRLALIPVNFPIVIDFEKYLNGSVSVSHVCICKSEYDPRRPSFQCSTCQGIFYKSCVDPNGGLETYRCKQCSESVQLKQRKRSVSVDSGADSSTYLSKPRPKKKKTVLKKQAREQSSSVYKITGVNTAPSGNAYIPNPVKVTVASSKPKSMSRPEPRPKGHYLPLPHPDYDYNYQYQRPRISNHEAYNYPLNPSATKGPDSFQPRPNTVSDHNYSYPVNYAHQAPSKEPNYSSSASYGYYSSYPDPNYHYRPRPEARRDIDSFPPNSYPYYPSYGRNMPSHRPPDTNSSSGQPPTRYPNTETRSQESSGARNYSLPPFRSSFYPDTHPNSLSRPQPVQNNRILSDMPPREKAPDLSTSQRRNHAIDFDSSKRPKAEIERRDPNHSYHSSNQVPAYYPPNYPYYYDPRYRPPHQ